MLFGIAALWLVVLSDGFFARTSLPGRFSPCMWGMGRGMLDDSIDLSPDGSGSILKRVVRIGNPSRIPENKDTIEISWKIWLEDGSLVHSSEDSLEEAFSFKLGAEPREVIKGWEACVWSMREGEVAHLVIQPDYAFGKEGAEPIGIPGNVTVTCEVSLDRIIPAISRVYQSVGLNESIKDELMEKIQTKESPIAEEAMMNKPINETKSDEERRYFNPSQHKVDPRLSVMGEGQGYAWEENASSLDVEIPLLDGISKRDLDVDIQTKNIKVQLVSGQVLLNGLLHGSVAADDCGWGIVDADPGARTRMRGRKLVVSLEKTYASREIWASLFDKDYIAAQQNLENQ